MFVYAFKMMKKGLRGKKGGVISFDLPIVEATLLFIFLGPPLVSLSLSFYSVFIRFYYGLELALCKKRMRERERDNGKQKQNEEDEEEDLSSRIS